jgi:hypothetical protein
MANLTFANLQDEVYAHSGLDSTDSTNQTNVSRWLNYVQQDICSRWPWTFMESRESIVTVPDYTTGTVSVTSGSTTVNGTLTVFTTTMAAGQYYIQFDGSNDWYKIATRVSDLQITIENGYAGTSDLTDSTFIVRKFFYSLSSACDRIIDIRNWNTPLKLTNVDPRTLDDLRPNPQSTNSSYGYLCWGYDSSGNVQVSPYPFPSDARILELRTIKRPTDDAISVPNKYAHLIAWGALAISFAFLRRFDVAQVWNAKFEQRIGEMKIEYRLTEDEQQVMKSIDSVTRSKWLSLPESYPVVMS